MLRPTGYTPSSREDTPCPASLLDALGSNLRSLAYKRACRLVSLDYVAFGYNGRAVLDRTLVGPPAETKKPPGWVAFLLVDQLGLEPRTDRL